MRGGKKKHYSLKVNFLGIYLLIILAVFSLIIVRTYLRFPENLIRSLIIVSCFGGIGGTIYSIRGFYKHVVRGNLNLKWTWWYLYRPLISIIIGIITYFLIIGGLLTIGSPQNITTNNGLMFYSAISFIAGFSFTQVANKLEELASTAFAKDTKKEGEQ